MNLTDLILLENCIWVLKKDTNVPAYDFDFSRFFDTSRPWERPEQLSVIGRFGAAKDYASHYATLKADGISLINSPEMHDLCSELPHWYPLIRELTPRSRWFAKPPRGRMPDGAESYAKAIAAFHAQRREWPER
ncbi:hypothetical protein [Halovulum sp. GXIMD14793]